MLAAAEGPLPQSSLQPEATQEAATQPTRPTDATAELHERPGMQIGPYKLLQMIGEGGPGAASATTAPSIRGRQPEGDIAARDSRQQDSRQNVSSPRPAAVSRAA